MAMQPEILILDEPTGQLDPIAASDFLNTLKNPGAGGYRYVWKENRWRVSPVKNGLNIGGDSSCWIS